MCLNRRVSDQLINFGFLLLLVAGIALVFQAERIERVQAACFPNQNCSGFGNVCLFDSRPAFCSNNCVGCYPPPCRCLIRQGICKNPELGSNHRIMRTVTSMFVRQRRLVPAAGAVRVNALVATFPLVATFQRTPVRPMLIPVCILEAVLPGLGPVVPAAVVPPAQSS